VSGGPAREPGSPDADAVILIDLRTGATNIGATDPASVGEETLAERQQELAAILLDGRADGQWQFIDMERLLVVDDADTFADHAETYQYLTQASTFGRLLCLVVGGSKQVRPLAIPAAVQACRAPVVWAGNSRGVGWDLQHSRSHRMTFNEADPDGSHTLDQLIDTLCRPEVYDSIGEALSDLPFRLGAAALLPWEPWPDPPPAGLTVHQAAEPMAAPLAPDPAGPELVPDPSPATPASPVPAPPSAPRLGWWYALGGALLVAAAGAGDAHGAVFVALAAACAIAGIVVIAAALRRRAAAASAAAESAEAEQPATAPAPATASPVDPAPAPDPNPEPDPQPPQGRDPRDLLARAVWLLSAPADDRFFRQLSSADQLLMLSGERETVRLVRFAAKSARPFLEGLPGVGPHVAWTTSGDLVGTIRLVPLKAGLLRVE